jgi:hypothetical protein
MGLSVQLAPEKMQNRMGASREVMSGTFTFPLETFAAGGSVTLVWVGPTKNWELTLTSEHLAPLR